jgi:CubicO group peptidase (beta-lactamase class C family)
MEIRRSGLVVAAACAAFAFTAVHASEIATITPDQVGLSGERLTRLEKAMQAEIDAGRKAGIITLIARNGRIAHLKAYGKADIAANRPMRTDSVVRLYSMTKPITSVALLMLYEEGKFQLGDPLDQYLPAFQNVKVVKSTDDKGQMQLEDPKRKITIHDVFRHTAGFVYGFGPTPLDKAYQQAGIDLGKLPSLNDFVTKLATQPLLYHPGERWVYSVAHDVQAALVEKLSGMPFDQFVRTRILEPLGMKDTGFGVPASLASRYTACYGPPEKGRLKEIEKADGTNPEGTGYARYTKIPFGGHSLSSTITDYLRFSQMLLNGGELDGVRLLGRKTVELMTSDNLPPGVEDIGPGGRYGLGVGYNKSPAESGNLGSRGQFGWGGAATTWVTIDPQEKMVGIVFTQYMPYDQAFLNKFQTLAYQALVDPRPSAPSP